MEDSLLSNLSSRDESISDEKAHSGTLLDLDKLNKDNSANHGGNVDDSFNSSDSGEVSENGIDEDSKNCDQLLNDSQIVQTDKTNKRDFDAEEESDDRSQTPLQDEHENTTNVEFKNQMDANSYDQNSIDIKQNEVRGYNQITKETALNDDHGELDYEEDVEESTEKSKLESGGFELPNLKKFDEDQIKNIDNQLKVDESHSSDGELADDDDCEEGEIKEPGAKKPFTRPLCRFFNRGSCTWGLNCRFLHPGVNDKGNYTMLEQYQYMQPATRPGMMPILRGPPPAPWIHERLGKRMPPPPRINEINESDLIAPPVDGAPTTESAWERGLRHAKEIRSKRKETDGDDEKKETSTSPVIKSPATKVIHPITSHLAPPPPRDPYYEDLHQSIPASLPGLPPMPLPMPPMMHHPADPWIYRHPFEYELRWPRPPPPMELIHPGFHHIHDFRMVDQGRGRRFSPPLRIESGNRVGIDRTSRYDRYRPLEGVSLSGEARGKCEEWKDPWSRAKSPKNKRSSSSRSGSGKKSRSKRRYSSFSSSSYSSKSHSRSSSFSSYTSSRSSFSSRSRSSSKLSKSIPKKVVPVGSLDKPNKNSDISKSIASKVVPPCVSELKEHTTIAISKHTSTITTNSQAPTLVLSSEPPKPTLASLSITLGNKPSLSNSKTNNLQPVNKAVAEAFKDVDEDNDIQIKNKSKMSKLPPVSDSTNLMEELNKAGEQVTTAGGIVYKSGIVQGNVGYPIPIKSSVPQAVQQKQKISSAAKKTSEKKKSLRSHGSSVSSNDSLSSSFSSSHSSHSSSSSNSNAYSDMASPISSDSSPNNRKQTCNAKISSGNVPSMRAPEYPQQKTLQPYIVGHRPGRGFRDGRGGSFRGERRDYQMEGRGGISGGSGETMRGSYRRNSRIDERGVPALEYSGRNVDHMRTDPKPLDRPGGRAGHIMDSRVDMREIRMNERTLPRKERREDYRMPNHRIMAQQMDNRMTREPNDRSRNNHRDRNIDARYQRRDGEIEEEIDFNWSRQPRESPREYRRVVNKSSVGTKYMEPGTSNRSSQRQQEVQTSSSRKRQLSPHQHNEKHIRMAPEIKDMPPVSRPSLSSNRQQRTSNIEDSSQKSPISSKYGKLQASSSGSKKNTSSRREELLMQLKAVEDAIAKKRSKNN